MTDDVVMNLKKVMVEWNGGSLEKLLTDEALEAVANEAVTSSMLLDMWIEDKPTHLVKELIQKTINKLEDISNKKPDDLEKLLTSFQDWGDVLIPTELLKSIWQLGETIDLYYEKKIDRLEMSVLIDAAMNARRWVRLRKNKDTRELETRKTEVLTFEAQEKLQYMNNSISNKNGQAPF